MMQFIQARMTWLTLLRCMAVGFCAATLAESPRMLQGSHFRILLPPAGIEAVRSADDIVVNDRLLDRVFIDEVVSTRFSSSGGDAGLPQMFSRSLNEPTLFGSDFDSSLPATAVKDVSDLRRTARRRFTQAIRAIGIADRDVSRAMMEGRFNPCRADLALVMYDKSFDQLSQEDVLSYSRERLVEILKTMMADGKISAKGVGWLKQQGVLTSFRRKGDAFVDLEFNGAALAPAHLQVLAKARVIDLEDTNLFYNAVRFAKWNEVFGDLESCIGATSIIGGKEAVFGRAECDRFREAVAARGLEPQHTGNSILAYFRIDFSEMSDPAQLKGQDDYESLRQNRYLTSLRNEALANIRSGSARAYAASLPTADEPFNQW